MEKVNNVNVDEEIRKIIQNKKCAKKRQCECHAMIPKITEKLKKYTIQPELFEHYVHSISYRYDAGRYSWEKTTMNCVNCRCNVDFMIYVIKYQIKLTQITEKTINLLVNSDCEEVIKYLADNGYKFYPKHVTMLLDNTICNSLKHILKTVNLDVSYLEKIINSSSTRGDDIVAFLEHNKDVVLTEKIFISVCQKKRFDKCNYRTIKAFKNQPKTIDVLSYVFDFGIPINNKTFTEACHTLNSELIDKFLDNKCIPTKNQYDIVINSSEYMTEEIKKSIIKKFVDYGYEITYDDLLLTIKHKIKFNWLDISKFNFDKKFTDLCCEHEFHPYPDKEKLSLAHLLSECGKRHSITNVRRIVKSGVKPTVECLENACGIGDNAAVIKFLILEGVQPNFKCIRSIVERTSSGSVADLVVSKYGEYYEVNKQKDNIGFDFGDLVPIKNIRKIKYSKNLRNFFNEAYTKTKRDNIYNEDVFNLKPDTSYNILKKAMLQYISINMLYKSNNTSIHINKKLEKYFDIPYDTIIQMIDIDKFMNYVIHHKPDVEEKIFDEKDIELDDDEVIEEQLDDSDEETESDNEVVKPKKKYESDTESEEDY